MICSSVQNGNKGKTDRTTDTLFKDGDPQNTSLLGGTYLSSPYMGVHHPYYHPPPPRLTGILTQWVMIPARIFTKVHESHLSGPISLIFFKVLPSSQGKIKTMFTCIFSFSRVGWGLELEAMKVYYGRCANGQLSTLTECNFIESFIWQCWKWDLNPPLKSQEIDENGLLE